MKKTTSAVSDVSNKSSKEYSQNIIFEMHLSHLKISFNIVT